MFKLFVVFMMSVSISFSHSVEYSPRFTSIAVLPTNSCKVGEQVSLNAICMAVIKDGELKPYVCPLVNGRCPEDPRDCQKNSTIKTSESPKAQDLVLNELMASYQKDPLVFASQLSRLEVPQVYPSPEESKVDEDYQKFLERSYANCAFMESPRAVSLPTCSQEKRPDIQTVCTGIVKCLTTNTSSPAASQVMSLPQEDGSCDGSPQAAKQAFTSQNDMIGVYQVDPNTMGMPSPQDNFYRFQAYVKRLNEMSPREYQAVVNRTSYLHQQEAKVRDSLAESGPIASPSRTRHQPHNASFSGSRKKKNKRHKKRNRHHHTDIR